MQERIAVLGGGIGSLSTVFSLTQQPDWADRYSITVYQLGWRLGGKAASGVNLAEDGRVEEHGLHVWFGFYQNAFRMMRECYDALGRPAGHPISTAEAAFEPVHHHTFLEEIDGEWMPWRYRFSGDGVLPGAPSSASLPDSVPCFPGAWGYVHRVLSWLRMLLEQLPQLRWLSRPPGGNSWLPERPAWRRNGSATSVRGVVLIDALQRVVQRVGSGAPPGPLVAMLDGLRRAVVQALDSDEPALRRLRIMADLTLTGVRGLVADEVPRHGYRSIDGEDFRAWLIRHGAAPEAADAPIVRTLYDIFFAYEGGDTSRPSVAAGATLRGMFRLLFGYHGAVLWKMTAGMGDAIIAPMYEVLRRRGVRFEFFHSVEGLHLDDHGRGVQAISMRRQARSRGDYEPLVDVKGLPCWPSEPRYEQLVDASGLAGIDLERPGQGEPLRLERGRDFDRVVLGISVGALGPICGELAEARPTWRAMLDHLGTVRTQALQLWFRDPLEAQGAPWPSGMVASYVQPFSSWSDFSQVIPREAWPDGEAPRYLAYSCGVLPDEDLGGPPDDPSAVEVVRGNAIRWLEGHAAPLWPATVCADGFAWQRLHDRREREGPERLDAQYLRANTAPSERYVLALPGTTRHRLRPGASGFDNLVLAGSWTDNDYTLSCIEATVMSGMMAARAVDGRQRHIVGEGDV